MCGSAGKKLAVPSLVPRGEGSPTFLGCPPAARHVRLITAPACQPSQIQSIPKGRIAILRSRPARTGEVVLRIGPKHGRRPHAQRHEQCKKGNSLHTMFSRSLSELSQIDEIFNLVEVSLRLAAGYVVITRSRAGQIVVILLSEICNSRE